MLKSISISITSTENLKPIIKSEAKKRKKYIKLDLEKPKNHKIIYDKEKLLKLINLV